MKRKKPLMSHQTGLSIAVLFFVAILMISAIWMVRTRLLKNTQELGMALTRSYALQEEAHIDSYAQIVQMAAQYINEIERSGGNASEIQSWLSGYFVKLTDLLGEGFVDPYAVIDGEIVAANPWEGDATYAYEDAEWYRDAIEAGGELVFSNLYEDAITGQLVFTISKQLSGAEDVLAMDVFLQNEGMPEIPKQLPHDYSFYLCDTDGTLIYSVTKWDQDPKILQDFACRLLNGIQDGRFSDYDASFQDLDGVTRGAYYYEMKNGWTVIMTIPLESVLFGDHNIVMTSLIVISIVLFLILTGLVLRDAWKNKKMKQVDDTIHMLGDSFYAIYRINFREETYEAIKIAPDMAGTLPVRGNYGNLIHSLGEFMEESSYHAFVTSFSLEKIRQRVAKKIPDFGGDFRRRFGEQYRWANIRTLYDPEVAPDEVIWCFRDVDAEKRQQLQHTIVLQEALEAAKKSTKAKAEFFSSMSHDMRTPLNAIIGFSKLAQEHCGEEDKISDYMKKIEFAGNQLLTLINDILELSRMEAGKSPLEQSSFDLQELLEQCADLFRENAQQSGKQFSTDIELQDRKVIGDPKKLAQIVNNLLSNAVKYSKSGAKICLEARQFAFQKHGKYQIVVWDTGIGMSPEFLEHIFDPYTRESRFSSRSAMGTGLGMSIVKSLVQQLSGEIAVESTLGKGSRVTVTLPFQTDGAVAEELPVPAEEEKDFDWAGRRVLIAEDSEMNMEIATEILTMCGAQVLQATNGAEAVHLFAAQPPGTVDVILMDMQMPEMDGCEATRAIRKLDRPDAQSVPIVAVTANAFAEDIARTMQAGMNAHISKPIDFNLLGEITAGLIAEHHGGENPSEDHGR